MHHCNSVQFWPWNTNKLYLKKCQMFTELCMKSPLLLENACFKFLLKFLLVACKVTESKMRNYGILSNISLPDSENDVHTMDVGYVLCMRHDCNITITISEY